MKLAFRERHIGPFDDEVEGEAVKIWGGGRAGRTV